MNCEHKLGCVKCGISDLEITEGTIKQIISSYYRRWQRHADGELSYPSFDVSVSLDKAVGRIIEYLRK